MGEFNESGCSWKKLVLTKCNENWVSNIRSENVDSGAAASCTTGFSSEDHHGLINNIKQEHEVNLQQYASGLNLMPNYPYDVPEKYEPELAITEEDPLLEDSGQERVRRQRRGSGPRQETPEARAHRLARMSVYAADRIARETPEQRALRLKRMSEYSARRLSRESPEQRAKRLARMSEYAARRIANETPEQRKARLKRMSEYAAKRHARKRMQSDGTGSSESSPSLGPTMDLRSFGMDRLNDISLTLIDSELTNSSEK